MDMKKYQDPETIRRILTLRRVAIVGLSANELRASNFVARYLQRNGYDIIPVNPMAKTILGETSYASLKDIPGPVDTVDVFRKPEAVPDIARDAVAIGAKCLWLQYNVISAEGAEIATRARLDVVMDRCMKVEHARYLGRMHWLGFNTGRVTATRQNK
ncbi:MAG: CoA-binding protein [Gammaproteobacteria bacterium]|nr:CoA-binding protein [Gammaproteobacteria bacterium]